MHAPSIVIDPGHGGEHNEGRSTALGCVAPSGAREKDVTLELGRRVASRFGGEAILTRDRDLNLSIGTRCASAASRGAPIFISLHANAGERQRGNEIFVHEEANSGSVMLASGIGRELQRFGGSQRGVVGAESMAVLSPQHHARNTAACLLETDYLARANGDPRELDELASAIQRGVMNYRSSIGYGRAPNDCATVDRTLPYDFSFVISRRIFSYSFNASGTLNLQITVQATSGFSPQNPGGGWPPQLESALMRCDSDGGSQVNSYFCAADGVTRNFSFPDLPYGTYFFIWRIRSEWNVMGSGRIS